MTRATLDSGLTVLVKQVYPSKVAGLSIWIRSGSIDETDEEAGYCHFLEHLLFRGTGAGMASEIQSLGGYLNGFTSHECTCYWTVLPARHLEMVLPVMARSVTGAVFDEADCDREREVILEELKMREDEPVSYCLEHLFGHAFRGHPYGRPIIGTEGSLRAADGRSLGRFYREHYRPDRMAVVVVGGLDEASVLRSVEAVFQAPPPDTRGPRRPQWPEAEHQPGRVTLQGEISSAQLQIGFPLPNLFQRDSFAADLLACILGRGRSSRLHRTLREELNLVSRVTASPFLGSQRGLFLVQAMLPADQVEEAETAVYAELERIAQGDVDAHELQKARNIVESAYVFGQETVEGQGRKLGYYEMMGDYRLSDDYVRKLWEIELEDLARVASRYLTADQATVAAYLPEAAPS